MNTLLTFIAAVIVAYICYIISTKVPFLAEFANLIGLGIFLLIMFFGWRNDWTFPRRG